MVFDTGNKVAICPAIDLQNVKFEGVKLNEPLDDIGTEFEQFVAQHRRAASAEGDASLLLALSQHFIILSFGEWSGVPDTTPLTTDKSTKRIKTRLRIEASILQSFQINK